MEGKYEQLLVISQQKILFYLENLTFQSLSNKNTSTKILCQHVAAMQGMYLVY